MAIGEAGTLSDNTNFTGEPISVSFTQPIDDPVIALMATNSGGNKFALRIIEIETDPVSGLATGFTFTIDEWENHDGRHPAVEDINWIAVKSGVSTLPDGRKIEAGYSDADSNGEPVSLTPGTFSEAPVVLTTVASDRFASNVDSDPTDVTAAGFTLSVEEAESQDGVHGLEKVAWIAIEPGGDGSFGTASNDETVDSDWDSYGLDATYSNPITVAETQTKNDPDTGSVIFRNLDPDEIDLRFEEDTSVDGDTGHAPETVGIVTFEAGLILCFTPGTLIDTPLGPRPVETLAEGDLVLTRDLGPQPLIWTCGSDLGAAALAADPSLAPVRIPAHAFGPGAPARDTLVSPQHRLLLTGPQAQLLFGEAELLAPAKALFAPAEPAGGTRYIHLLFDRHHIVTANGMPMESFHPGDMAKSALDAHSRDQLFTRFPDLRWAPSAWGPTARRTLRCREATLLAA
jgi:hypothetical protein